MKALLVLFTVLSLSACLPSPMAVSEGSSEQDSSTQEEKEFFFAVSLADAVDEPDLNTGKIATEHTAFSVLVYSGEVDFDGLSWADFFTDYYPEVLSFESFVLAGKSESNAVIVTKTDGMWLGSKRVFVHVGDSFYDFSLHSTRPNQEKAESLFWDFVKNFQL